LHVKKHPGFSASRKLVSDRILKSEDIRQESKVEYSLHDCRQGAFAMMFFQDPSLNAFQQRLQEKRHLNNLKTMFNVNAMPRSTQSGTAVDNIPSTEIESLFSDFRRPLQRGKQMELLEFMDKKYLIPLDGAQYFSSSNISCKYCLEKNHKNGETTCRHQTDHAISA